MDSKLQIISGRFHGRKLYLPPNARPTQNRARAALFNMLAAGLVNVGDNLCVWDAFAGSGAFGIEFLSRYPNSRVIFTDIDPESRVASRIKDGAILIWEQELSQSVMPPVEWRILRDKTYGRARFFVLTRGDE